MDRKFEELNKLLEMLIQVSIRPEISIKLEIIQTPVLRSQNIQQVNNLKRLKDFLSKYFYILTK